MWSCNSNHCIPCINRFFSLKKQRLARRRIAIQGLGSVGGALAQLCLDAGALVFATEINPAVAEAWSNRVHLSPKHHIFNAS